VLAIVGLIPGTPATGVGNLVDQGGFAPTGIAGSRVPC
jgi:AAT family amino acid transporter